MTLFGNNPFCGGFGLLTKDGIPKPAFYAYKLFSMLGNERYELPKPDSAEMLEMAAFRNGNQLQLLLYNQQMPSNNETTESIEVTINGISDVHDVIIQRIDDTHGNPKPLWQAMGSPDYLTRAQAQELTDNSRLVVEPHPYNHAENRLTLQCTLAPHNVALITVS